MRCRVVFYPSLGYAFWVKRQKQDGEGATAEETTPLLVDEEAAR
jgi:hypothetical protein